MDKNRDGWRVAMATPNGLPRPRHRTSSLSDSPEDDGALGLQETARFRDRTVKRDRDREKERSDRDRDRLSRSKRRREDGVRDSSGESFFDEDQEDPDDVPVRVVPPNPASVSSSSSPSSALTSMRKSYPPPSKFLRAAPSWKAPDEINGFSIPRKARSASTKRSHDYWSPPAVGGEQFLRQASSSLVRPGVMASSAVASPSPAPLSPSSSSISMKKKFKANGHKQRPPKSSTKPPSSIQDDIEIEVAEVLYGLMRQSHGPSKQEMMSNASARWDYKEVSRSSTGDSKSRASSPISNSISAPAQDLPQTSNSSAPPLSAVATKRKRPRPVCHQEKIFSAFASQSSPNPTASKIEPYVFTKQEVHSQMTEKNSVLGAEIGRSSFNLVKSHELQMACKTARSEPVAEVFSSEDNRSLAVDKSQGQDTVTVEEVPRLKKETVNDHVEYTSIQQSVIMTATTGEKETHREEKYEIDLMASPQQSRSSPEREEDMDHQYHQDLMATDRKTVLESKPIEGGKHGRVVSGGNDLNTDIAEKVSKYSLTGAEEGETQKPVLNKARNSEIHFDLERVDKKASPSSADDNKLNQPLQKLPLNPSRDDTSFDKPAQRSSLPLSMSLPAGWPPGLPPMGYLAPLQGAVSMDGRPMPPTNIEPPNFLFTQPQPGRCATHWYIAKNIQSHMQLMNSYPFWPTGARAAPLFGAKPCNLNVVPTADVNPAQDKGQALAYFPGPQPAAKDKDAQPTTNIADGPQKKRFYQVLPPGGPSNMLHGPANLFFPLGQQQQQQQHVVVANSTKSPVQAGIAASMGMSTSVQTSPAAMSFNYPNMHANETQYLAILANGAYQFPIPTHISSAAQAYRGVHPQVMPFFNGSYYPSQILHPSQLQQQQQQPSPSSQPTQIQQNHQNPSISTASSSSHKHPQNQQQKPQGNDNSTNPGLQTFSTPKSTARPPNVSFYGQNFALPFNPSNFALMTPPNSLSGATTGASKSSMAPQAFAMSFSSMNGATTAPGPDFTSIAQNHAFLQNNYQLMAAAAAAAATQAVAHQKKKKKNDHGSEDGKSGAPDDGRKGAAAKAIISNATDATSSQQQQQFNIQLQKQQEYAISNSTAKFPNALSGFPESMSLGQQQQGIRPQQGHNNTQTSFWGNPKVGIAAAAASQGQQGADVTQSPSSVSKGGHTWKHKDDHILVNG